MSLLASPGVANSDVMTVSVVSDIEKVIKSDLPPVPESTQPVDRIIADAATSPAGRIELIRRARELGGGGLADLLAARDGLARVAAASAAGTTTAARDDTQLKLGEGEVMDVAQDYSDPRLGEGLARAAAAIRGDWPSAKDALWLGESGKPLAVDMAFRAVGEEKLADFADLLKAAVSAQEVNAIDELLVKMA